MNKVSQQWRIQSMFLAFSVAILTQTAMLQDTAFEDKAKI
jgi:hypothetical protein